MIRELSFVELTVSDWPAALAWYRDVLGLEVLLCDGAKRFALLRAGAGRLTLKAGNPEPGSVLLTFEVDDLSAELRRLALRGVSPEAAVKESPEGYRRALIRDPDGHRLALFEWTRAGARP